MTTILTYLLIFIFGGLVGVFGMAFLGMASLGEDDMPPSEKSRLPAVDPVWKTWQD